MTNFSEVAIMHIQQNLYAAYSGSNGYDESAYYAMYQTVRRASSAQDMLTRLTRERGDGYEGRSYSSPEYTRIMNTLHETLMDMGRNMLSMEEVLGNSQMSAQNKTRTALTMMRIFMRGYVSSQLSTTENSNAALDTLIQKLDGCVSGTEFINAADEYQSDLRRRCGQSRLSNRMGMEQRYRVASGIFPALKEVYVEELNAEARRPALLTCYGVQPTGMKEEEWHMTRLGYMHSVRMGMTPRFVKLPCAGADMAMVFDTLMLVDVYEGEGRKALQYMEKRNGELCK